MRLWLDCEFNDFGGELISMALVSDGPEWYQSLGCASPSPWVADNVMPVIDAPTISRPEFILSLGEFLWQFEKLDIIADWPDDISYFCQSLITGPGGRIDTPPLRMEIRRDLDGVSAVPHNALYDARAIKAAWYALHPHHQGLRTP